MDQSSSEQESQLEVVEKVVPPEQIGRFLSDTLEETSFQGFSSINLAPTLEDAKAIAREEAQRIRDLRAVVAKAYAGNPVKVRTLASREIFDIPLQLPDKQQTKDQ